MAKENNLVGAKMWTALIISKYRGIRGGDLVRLCWNQVAISQDGVEIAPTRFKNERFSNRWRFRVKATDGLDNITEAFSTLRRLSKIGSGRGPVFGSWKSSTIAYHLKRNSKMIGESISLHQIRVLTTIGLTAIGWSDEAIKQHLNWTSLESLERYRAGIDLGGLTNLNSLENLYKDRNVQDRVNEAVKKSKFGK